MKVAQSITIKIGIFTGKLSSTSGFGQNNQRDDECLSLIQSKEEVFASSCLFPFLSNKEIDDHYS